MVRQTFQLIKSYYRSVRQDGLNFFILVLILPWLVPIISYQMWDTAYYADTTTFVAGTLINLVLCAGAHHTNQLFASYVSRKFPHPDQSVYRFGFWSVLYACINITLLAGVLLVYDHFNFLGYVLEFKNALLLTITLLGASVVAAGLTEVAYTLVQWKANQLEIQQLEHKQVQAELELVKQQVNPHFLFNCLNSLSVLISEAPDTAERFVEEMARVYRYLLSVNGPDKAHLTVTLDAEIRFLKSYVYLLETRYESGISISVNVSDHELSSKMAPLTLQTLIDNAIRHNIVSAKNPLSIHIHTIEAGKLEVRNNLQKRTLNKPTGALGLGSLVSHYQFLFHEQGSVKVLEDDLSFTVTLPLVKMERV